MSSSEEIDGRAGAYASAEAGPWGAFLRRGATDWQILQQDSEGLGRLLLEGRWAPKEGMGIAGAGGDVQWRLVSEETGAPLHDGFSWSSAETGQDGKWRAAIGEIPAGGLYRLETRFNPKGNKLGEWAVRGDMRHFLGVGDLWIVAGQSNASGYARAPAPDAPELGLHVLRQDGRWGLAAHPLQDGTDTIFPANLEKYNAGHSPFLHFARLLKRELGHPIGILPAALGGSPLEDWHPRRGPLFANLAAMVARAGGSVRGMVWCQGETDAEPGRAETYLERFLESLDGWREALGRELPVLTVQTGRYRSQNPGEEDREWSLIREAQRRAAHLRPGVTVVPALDLALDDTIHFATSGNLDLAGRLARCALGAVYGRRVEYRAPELAEAVRRDGSHLELRFAPVTSRLDTRHPLARPFRVEDGQGVIGTDAGTYYRRDTVRLRLARMPEGPMRVSCGYGEDPDALPVDVDRQLPVLACHGFPVTEA